MKPSARCATGPGANFVTRTLANRILPTGRREKIKSPNIQTQHRTIQGHCVCISGLRCPFRTTYATARPSRWGRNLANYNRRTPMYLLLSHNPLPAPSANIHPHCPRNSQTEQRPALPFQQVRNQLGMRREKGLDRATFLYECDKSLMVFGSQKQTNNDAKFKHKNLVPCSENCTHNLRQCVRCIEKGSSASAVQNTNSRRTHVLARVGP